MSNRLEEIDLEIKKLKDEKNLIVSQDMSQKNILERFKLFNEHSDYEVYEHILDPFSDYEEKFSKELGVSINSMIADELYLPDVERYQEVTIYDIALVLCLYAGVDMDAADGLNDNDLNKLVNIYYERYTEKIFQLPLLEALEQLEKYAHEEEVYGFKIDW